MLLANESQEPLEELSILIGQLRNKGVALWVQDGMLRLRHSWRGILAHRVRRSRAIGPPSAVAYPYHLLNSPIGKGAKKL